MRRWLSRGEPRRRTRRRGTLAATGLLVALAAADLGAQSPERFTIASAIGVDTFGGENAVSRPNIVFDVSAVVRLGAGWELFVRPWIRQPRTPEWDIQLYQAELRYERPGPVSMRLETGAIASPVGQGMFDMGPAANPTIMPHLAYFVPMPAIDRGAPRVMPIAMSYPLGAQLTLSTDRWDARAALVSTAPTRINLVGADAPPRATPVFEAGAGVTPKTGLRFGVSLATGAYATGDELAPSSSTGRQVTIIGAEAEYAFRYTKLSGEVLRSGFERAAGTAAAYLWSVEAVQTLTPRWFAAAREEGASGRVLPAPTTPDGRASFHTADATLGFRASPEITLRGGYFGRRLWGRDVWDHQVGASIVWAHRWR